MENKGPSFIKKCVDEFISTNKERYDLFSSLQDNLNEITSESYPEIIDLIKKHTQYFFKDHPTAVFLLRIIIRFAKYNLKQMELILDIIIHFISDFNLQQITEIEIIELCENVLNPINYLYDQKVISIESIISKSIFNEELFINFLPEIELYDKEYSMIREKKILNLFDQPGYENIKSFYNLVKSDPSVHILNRSLNYHPSSLHKSIREDDIETFQSILSKNNYSVNHRIEYSVYERSHTPDKKMSLIQIAAIYGSLKVFKFLWLQKEIVFDKNLQRYANYGNNYEIIHLFEFKCSYKNIIDDLIAFNRHELFDYFIENFGNENFNEYFDDEIQNDIKKIIVDVDDDVDNNEICKVLNYQNLICAVSFSNIPIILSCLQKIVLIVKNIEISKMPSLLQRSEFDFELFKFLFNLISNESLPLFNAFYYSLKINAFDAFNFLIFKLKAKIDYFQLFTQCIKLNNKMANYILDLHNLQVNEYSTVFSILNSSLTFSELALAIEYYDEDVVVKMIDFFNLIDSPNDQPLFILRLTENISSKMILSLFKKLVLILPNELLKNLSDHLYCYELFEVCEFVLDHLKRE